MAYTALKPGQAAAYGTQGDAVRQLQTQLNSQYAGQAGYVPLVVDGKYGDKTRAATTFKPTPTNTGNVPGTTPTASPIAGSTVRRYTGTGANTGYDAAAADYYNGLDTTAPDRQKIYNEQLSQMQAQIDAINNVYTGLIAKENVAGQGRNGQTRAVNSRSGILGDDFGNANKAATEDYNAAKVEDLNRKKSLEIQSILTQVQQRADAQFEKANELSLANKEKKLAYHQELQKESRQNLADLAKTGVTLDQLSQDEYNQLVDQTGYDDLEFESIFNAAKTAREKVDYKYTNIGNGKVLRTGVDGEGKALEEKIFDYGLPPDYDLKETKDGSIYLFDKTTGQMVKKKAGSTPGDGDTGTIDDPVVKAWANNIKNGTSTMANVPANLKNSVAKALDAGGTGTSSKNSELKSQAYTSGTELLSKLQAGKDNYAVGGIGAIFPALPGTKKSDFRSQFDNFTSLLQLDAAKYLKGQGAISEGERAILQGASGNLKLTQSKKEFERNLKNILDTLKSVEAKNSASSVIPDQDTQIEELKASGFTDEQIQQLLNS